MKVALVNPGKSIEFALIEPLNLCFIAAFLEKHNIEVKIIDELAGQNVKKSIEKFNPDIVGITAVTPLVQDAYRIADMCKEMGIRTVMGGVHASILPEEALKRADIVVKGEGEMAMLDIINKEIKSGIVSSPYIKDLDEIPIPARHLVDMDFYLRIPETHLVFIPPNTKSCAIITSRGCPYNCTFCHNSWRGTPYRCNSPERIIEEIKHLINTYGVEALYFVDDNLFLNKPRLRKICELIKENNIDIIWACNSRVDNLDMETMKLANESGCKQLIFGFESGSQRILDILSKGTTVEQNKKAIELCHEVGLLATGSFMIGNPTETVEDIKATQQFIKENKPDFAGICITTPFPGTKMWDWCKEHKLVPESVDWSKFIITKFSPSMLACDTIPPEELEKLFYETDALIVSKKKRVTFSWLLSMVMKHPIKTFIMAYRARKSLFKYIKKFK